MPRKKRPEGTRAPNGESSIYHSEADGYWHGWVTVGIRDNGEPDRRHRMNKDEKKLRDAVRKLENERDAGTITKAGSAWTVEKWLTHWLENIARPSVRYKAYQAYRSAVNVHLIPGLGAHRLTGPRAIQPEHFEKLYSKIQASGRAPATAHQVHRTARTAFGEAFRRGHMGRNVVALAKPPRLEEKDIPALEVEGMQRVIETALRRRNGVRYVVALALGLRQGESLGLEWVQLDEKRQTISLRDQIQRRTWEHGCSDPHACGERLHKRAPCRPGCKKHTRECPPPCSPDCVRHASSCPQRHGGGLVKAPVKSKAGRRPMGVPDTVFILLLIHKEEQDREREFAGTVWEEHGLMFCQPTGRPIDPSKDLDEWKSILAEAGMDEERLHAARHSFATLLGLLQIPDRAVQGVMGWSDAAMAKRYQKMNDPVLRLIAEKVEGALWNDNRN